MTFVIQGLSEQEFNICQSLQVIIDALELRNKQGKKPQK